MSYLTSYIVPQTFREWHPIGIYNNINKNKPYYFNIGYLPIILWFNTTNHNCIINSCKHLGNNMNNGFIKNNCFICPHHNLKYTDTDKLGDIKLSNGLLWWSYKSFQKEPIKSHNYLYKTSFDVNTNILGAILNLIDDFNYTKIKKFKKSLLLKNNNNSLFYKYPYSIIFKNEMIMINILPLTDNKTKLFISSDNIITDSIVNKYKKKLEKTHNDFKFKYMSLYYNKYIDIIYDFFKNYMHINENTVFHFLTNKRYY